MDHRKRNNAWKSESRTFGRLNRSFEIFWGWFCWKFLTIGSLILECASPRGNQPGILVAASHVQKSKCCPDFSMTNEFLTNKWAHTLTANIPWHTSWYTNCSINIENYPVFLSIRITCNHPPTPRHTASPTPSTAKVNARVSAAPCGPSSVWVLWKSHAIGTAELNLANKSLKLGLGMLPDRVSHISEMSLIVIPKKI